MSVIITVDGEEITINDSHEKTIVMKNDASFEIDAKGLISNVILPKGLAKFEIPEGVKSIGERVLFNCAYREGISLTSIKVPGSVTSILVSAFEGLRSLESVILQEGVTRIKACAFESCSSLESIEIPNSVTSIGPSAFFGCRITSIKIPQGVTSISECAFRACDSLESVILQEGVTRIEAAAFEDCYSLKSIIIPQGVTSIGDGAFAGCDKLGIVICYNPEIAKDINEHKLKYFGKSNASTEAITDNPYGNAKILEIINNKIDGIKDDGDQAKLKRVLGDLSKRSFKEKVLIYKCLLDGSFDFKKFMKLVDSESGLSEKFHDIRIRVIRDYGHASLGQSVVTESGVPLSHIATFLDSNGLAALARLDRSGFEKVIGRKTGVATDDKVTIAAPSSLSELFKINLEKAFSSNSLNLYNDRT